MAKTTLGAMLLFAALTTLPISAYADGPAGFAETFWVSIFVDFMVAFFFIVCAAWFFLPLALIKAKIAAPILDVRYSQLFGVFSLGMIGAVALSVAISFFIIAIILPLILTPSNMDQHTLPFQLFAGVYIPVLAVVSTFLDVRFLRPTVQKGSSQKDVWIASCMANSATFALLLCLSLAPLFFAPRPSASRRDAGNNSNVVRENPREQRLRHAPPPVATQMARFHTVEDITPSVSEIKPIEIGVDLQVESFTLEQLQSMLAKECGFVRIVPSSGRDAVKIIEGDCDALVRPSKESISVPSNGDRKGIAIIDKSSRMASCPQKPAESVVTSLCGSNRDWKALRAEVLPVAVIEQAESAGPRRSSMRHFEIQRLFSRFPPPVEPSHHLMPYELLISFPKDENRLHASLRRCTDNVFLESRSFVTSYPTGKLSIADQAALKLWVKKRIESDQRTGSAR